MKRNIPLMKVFMSPKEELMPELEKTLYSGMVTEGEKVIEFENKLQGFINSRLRPLSTNSCTSALQLAYRCAKVRDKIVLATPMTCCATNMPIFPEGGKIVWCDIDPKTGNIDSKDVEKKILEHGPENIAAISFVDFAGYPADLTELGLLREKYEIPLIEDAAQSLGANWYGADIGSVEHVDFTCFSHQAIKHLTTIDGGSLVVQNDEDWELAKRLKWYGINREAVKEATRWHYDIPDYGYKFHMNNVNATIGITQLDHAREIIWKHKLNGMRFDMNLEGINDVETMTLLDNVYPSYWIYMIKVEDRENFAKMMTDAGIGVNVAHVRNDQYTCFKDKNLVINPNEERPGLDEFNDKYIAIPCGWWVTKEDNEYIVETIKKGW